MFLVNWGEPFINSTDHQQLILIWPLKADVFFKNYDAHTGRKTTSHLLNKYNYSSSSCKWFVIVLNIYKELTTLSPLLSTNLILFYGSKTLNFPSFFQKIYYNFPYTNWFCPNSNLLYWTSVTSTIYSILWGFLPVPIS